MISDEDGFYMKIIELKRIHNFVVHDFFWFQAIFMPKKLIQLLEIYL
jgi:hypothetical protein